MLVVVMHNNLGYLQHLSQLAQRENIAEYTIIEKRDLGMRVLGGNTDPMYSKGQLLSAYEKAFVAAIKGEGKVKHFMELIEDDDYLQTLNLRNKGFLCTLPFHHIKNFELEIASINKEVTKMNISDLLTPDRIILQLKASSKNEAIAELGNLLKDADELNDFNQFITNVFEREKLSTTGVGNHVAIPHARSDAANRFVIAFGRSLEGINFDSLDKKPAKLIFLMGSPKIKQLHSYLKTLAHLTRLLKNADFQIALMQATTSKEIIEIFRKAESEST